MFFVWFGLVSFVIPVRETGSLREAQFQPKLFSLMTGAEMPCSRTLRPLELWSLLRLPLVPPLLWLWPPEEAVTAADARPVPLL
jgi:hypothetical protein